MRKRESTKKMSFLRHDEKLFLSSSLLFFLSSSSTSSLLSPLTSLLLTSSQPPLNLLCFSSSSNTFHTAIHDYYLRWGSLVCGPSSDHVGTRQSSGLVSSRRTIPPARTPAPARVKCIVWMCYQLSILRFEAPMSITPLIPLIRLLNEQ